MEGKDTIEEVQAFAKDHLSWIHQVEMMAQRRLTDHEVLCLRDLETINNFDTRINEVTQVFRAIEEASQNFVEGILPSA